MASKTLNTILSLQDNVSKKLVGVSSNFKNLSKEAQKATLSAQKSLNNIGKSVEGTVTKLAKLGTGIGAVATGMALGTGLGEAMNLEGYRVQLETATKSTQKAAEIMKYSIDLANKTPFEGGEMVEASAKLESMGLSAKSYLGNIVDMAAATNKPIDQATEAFIDAQTGELERLKEFGIKKADIQAKANQMFAGQETINNQGQIVNQENFNKALLAIMDERYTGGAEKLSKTTKGMWSTVTGITKSALSKIVGIQEDGTIKSGSLVDKIKEKVQILGDKLTQWQSDGTLDNIANKFTEVFGKAYEIVSKLINFIVEHKDIIITIASMAVAFTVVSKAIRGLTIVLNAFKVVWAILNGTILLSPIGWIIIGITALVGAFVLAYQKSETFRNFINQLWEKFKEFGTYLATVIPPILQQVATWFTTTIVPALQSIGDKLLNLWNTVILPFITWLVTTLTPVFQAIFPIIKQIVMDTFNAIGTVIQSALQIFGGIIDFVTGVFTGNWSLAWQGVVDIFGGIFSGLAAVLKVPLNAVIGLINGAIGQINSAIQIDVPDWVPEFGGKHFGLSIPQIPMLYKGTDYFKGGPALVGERGPELVNMPSGSKVITADKTKQILNGNAPVFNIYFNGNIGTKEFFDQAGEHIVGKINLALANM